MTKRADHDENCYDCGAEAHICERHAAEKIAEGAKREAEIAQDRERHREEEQAMKADLRARMDQLTSLSRKAIEAYGQKSSAGFWQMVACEVAAGSSGPPDAAIGRAIVVADDLVRAFEKRFPVSKETALK